MIGERTLRHGQALATLLAPLLLAMTVVVLVGSFLFGPWHRAEIPLPGGAGTLWLESRPGDPFFGGRTRRVLVALPDGRLLRAPLPWDDGGIAATEVLWRPVEDGAGPMIRIQDRDTLLLGDLGRGCLWSLHQPEPRYPCALAPDPAGGWSLLGRIGGGGGYRPAGGLSP